MNDNNEIYKQMVWLIAGLILGIFTGIYGNVVASLYFEVFIKDDPTYSPEFWFSLAVLVILIIVLLGYLIIYAKKAFKKEEKKLESKMKITPDFKENDAKEINDGDDTSLKHKIYRNPPILWFCCFCLFLLASLTYWNYYTMLEISQLDKIVELIVQTDGVILGFFGIITSLVLKDMLKKPQSIDKKCLKDSNSDKFSMLLFVFFTFFSLTFSIFFGIAAIITQFYSILLMFSLSFFFTGIVLLFATLLNSIEKNTIQK